jgi:cytochrome c biogenesis protein CcmG/thiol:disulfide interchange protein DsbE
VRRFVRSRRLLALAIAALALAALAAGLLLRAPDDDVPAVAGATPAAKRELAPELAGTPLDPPPVRLRPLRGKPVVINFWASWCAPCRKEAPELARFDRDMRARARLVGVNFQDAKSDALAFVREFHWRFPNVRDPRGKLAGRYGLVGLPTTFVLDARGRIARQLTGAQTFAKLVRAVNEVK